MALSLFIISWIGLMSLQSFFIKGKEHFRYLTNRQTLPLNLVLLNFYFICCCCSTSFLLYSVLHLRSIWRWSWQDSSSSFPNWTLIKSRLSKIIESFQATRQTRLVNRSLCTINKPFCLPIRINLYSQLLLLPLFVEWFDGLFSELFLSRFYVLARQLFCNRFNDMFV